MSIYASWRGLDSEHEDECGIWVEVEPNLFEQGDEKDCTCGLPRAPLIYRGSHVLPSDDDPKAGEVEIASIPDHITRDGRDDGAEGPKNWLRLGVYADAHPDAAVEPPGSATLILTRKHVEILRDELTAWLERPAE